MSKNRVAPDILNISPSALDDWERCPRLYANRNLLRLPPSDRGSNATTGNLVHDLLRFLHDDRDCRDPEIVTEVLEAHGVEPAGAVATMLQRHTARCPSPSPALGHEMAVVRLRRGAPTWIGVGRLDAVWLRGSVLEVRDYKTGILRDGDLGSDSRARLQAWLAAPIAGGRQIRIRYEYLSADDDPAPYEPDADDLLAIEAEISAVVATIKTAAADGPAGHFVGVNDAAICRFCSYRSICPDSAVPGNPTWPDPNVPDPNVRDPMEEGRPPPAF